MFPRTHVCLLFVIFALSSLSRLTAVGSDSSFIAAVYEHRVVLNPEPQVPLSRRAALRHLQQNLEVYEEQAFRAARQGAQILVFPEDGLQGFNFTRSSIFAYLEVVPDPQEESWNPCVEPGRHPDTEGVRQVVFPTAWMNQLPLLDTIQFQQAFSLGANVNLLAANIRNEHMIMTGSGIYSPSSAVYHHAQRGHPEEGRLLVAVLPVLKTPPYSHSQGINSDSLSEARVCHTESCSTCHSVTFVSSMMYDPFMFVLLPHTEGEVRVCDVTFCCQLQYQRSPAGNTTEIYALGAFSGTHVVNGRYSLQVCALVKCAGTEPRSCGQEVEEADTKMDFVLEGEFNTRHVYPSVLASRYVLEQPDHLERTARGRVTMKHSNMTAGLLTACLYGRPDGNLCTWHCTYFSEIAAV